MDTLAIELESLLVILVVSYLAPYIANLIPGRPVPEAVFLVFAGTLLGPNGIDVISTKLDSIQLLSQLGCAFLFLMAGYEINVKQVAGPMGRHASLTWVLSLAIAILVVTVLPLEGASDTGRLAFALAMTTTAYGTLAPIMRDREIEGTPVGNAVSVYGATGEVLPVLAMGILLSTTAKWTAVLSIAVYLLLCLLVLRRSQKVKARRSRTVLFLRDNAENASQAPVRATILLLVFLIFVAHDLSIDIVVGAFAAGFILRALKPEGDHLLEGKLDAIAFGFLVPIFFIESGTAIDLTAVADNPALFIGFIGLLLLVRAVPVFLSPRFWPESKMLSVMESFSASMYCSMALPVIVAVTSVAVEVGAMSESMASVLVTGGAFTVLAVPLITSLTRNIETAHPVQAIHRIVEGSENASTVLREHRESHHDARRAFLKARKAERAQGRALSSADWFAVGHLRQAQVAAEAAAKNAAATGDATGDARGDSDQQNE